MYVRVTVIPNAKRERVTETGPERFEMEVREPAARNLANARVRALLASRYTVGSSAVRLISGHRSPRKIFDVDISHDNS